MADKPLPQVTDLTAPYWRAAAAGRLAIQHCRGCGRWIHFPEPRCSACGSADLGWDDVSGRGAVATFSVVHRSFVEGFDGDPYVIAWIDLSEQPGLRVFGNITGCAPDAVRIGLPVELWFERRADMSIPNFRSTERGEQE